MNTWKRNAELRMRRAARVAARGVTLVEVMIVVVILGLISAGVAVAVIPKLKEGQINTTKISARELRTAASQWRGIQGGDKCPTIELLKQEKAIDSASKVTDAWDTPFKIICEEDETVVSSAGSDKKDGTQDDIRIPEAASTK